MLADLVKEFGTETGLLIASVGGIMWLIKHYTAREEKTRDTLIDVMSKNVDVISKNTEAFTKLSSTIEKNIDITEKSSERIEDIWLRAIKNNGNNK